MRVQNSKQYQLDLQKVLGTIDLKQLKNKSVFITGGVGLIGSAVADLLIASGRAIDVTIACRRKEQFLHRFSLEEANFFAYDALNSRLDLYKKFDYIIHCAGVSNPSEYTIHPVETMLSNMRGIVNILEYAKYHKGTRVLYVSSSEIYGVLETVEPLLENAYGSMNIDNIRNSYGIAKQASEMLCKSYQREYGVDVVIARPGHIYGPSASPYDRRLASHFLQKAANGEQLIMKTSGEQRRSYCYSLDCAKALLYVLLKGEPSESYNVGSDEAITIRQMAKLIAENGGVNLTFDQPTGEESSYFNPMNNSQLDNSKIKKIGYKDSFSIYEGVTHTIEILRELSQDKISR